MVKNIKLRKVFALVALFATALTSFPMINKVEAAIPALSVTALSSTTVKEGGSVSFTLKYHGDIKLITLSEKSIGLDGFTATKKITVSGNDRIVTLSNIKSTNNVYTGKYVHIAGGTAISSDLQMVRELNTQVFTIVPKDTKAPVLTISKANPTKVYNGGTVTYTLKYADDVKVKMITLNEKSLGLKGFTADKKVVINKDNTATVTLSNIQGEIGGNKVLYVAGGTAIDEDLNMANEVTAEAFTIEAKPEEPKPEEPKPVQPTQPVKPQPQKPSDWKDNPNTGI